MAIRVLLGALLTAIVLFFWGWVFWMYMPMSFQIWKTIPTEHETTFIEGLKNTLPESGVYMYPWLDTKNENMEAANDEFMKKHTAGPLVQVYYRAVGIESMTGTMVMGFSHMLVSALLCGAIMALVANSLRRYWRRVFFVVLLGTFATFWIEVANPIWWHHPWSNALFFAAYEVPAWLLGGLVLSAFVKPKVNNPS